MFSEAENFCRNLHFLLLTETDGNGQLNISMQQLATSFDLVLKIFITILRYPLTSNMSKMVYDRLMPCSITLNDP